VDSFRDRYLEALAQDPLTPQSRAQHRNLLIAGSLAILVAQLNLVPTRISALGVVLQSNDRHAIRIAILIVVVYFTVVFAITAGADVLAWRDMRRGGRAAKEATSQNLDRFTQQLAASQKALAELARREDLAADDREDRLNRADEQLRESIRQLGDVSIRLPLYRLLMPINFARGVMDFGIPMAVSITAVVLLSKGL